MKKTLMAILGAILFTTGTAQATNFMIPVECWSDTGCANTSIASVCGSMTPVAISCTQVKTPPSQTRTCGAGTCGPALVFASGSVGDFCKDINGYDALVTCSSP